MINTDIKIAIAGIGAIGGTIFQKLEARLGYTIVAATNNNIPSGTAADSLFRTPEGLNNIDYDMLIEALPPKAVPAYALQAIKAGKAALLLTTGVLSTCPEILQTLARSNGRIIVPYGAISTVPNIKVLKNKEITAAHHKVTKPIAGLKSALEELGYDLATITAPITVFDGSAEEAIKAFGKNVNTSITLSLLCKMAFKDVRVTITADPNAKGNKHHVTASGQGFSFDESFENAPSKDNPGTSAITPDSALEALYNPKNDAALEIDADMAQKLIKLNTWSDSPTLNTKHIGTAA